MSNFYSTPKPQRYNRAKDQNYEAKEDRFLYASVSEFSSDTQPMQVEVPSFDVSRPLGHHNKILESQKENAYRKSTVPEMSELSQMLEKIQIVPDEDEKQQQKPLEPKRVKQGSTCRFIPLRREVNSYNKNEEFQMLQQEQAPQLNCRKGQDYVDQGQMSLKDIYRMHVLGIPSQNQSDEVFQHKNDKLQQMKFDDRNSLVNTYDQIERQKQNGPDEYNRKISKIPFKVLDAPSLQDDFYLNLIDWSSQNILAVALSQCVYLWSAQNNKVVKFCDFGSNDEMVCSLAWSPIGHQLSVGTSSGQIHMFDANKMKRVGILEGHNARVGSLAWSNNALCSGSKDKSIHLHDLRSQKIIGSLEGHKQEVCGLKWSPDEYQLASGGNDNKLFVWTLGSERPLAKFSQHQAAVKALAWSPHRHGLLASGGGTADRTIRFFNTQTTQQLDWIDTGSQVCNLLFSKNINELISTHGYSMNQIVCWKYPSLEKVTTLTGHTSRVLFLAMSPDGETIVTGAGDETLRFWNIFPKKQEEQIPQRSPLVPSTLSLR